MTGIIQQKFKHTNTINNLCIRRAIPADAGDLQRLYHDYLGTHESYELNNIKKSIESDNVYVATIDSKHIVGTLTSTKIFDNGEWDIGIKDGGVVIGNINYINIGDELIFFDSGIANELRGLCVKDAYRYFGIATALLERAQSEMRDSAYALVWAPGGNERARKLWESHGFELQETVKDIGKLVPWFCEQCAERKNGCNYCDCYVYTERKDNRETCTCGA